MGFWGAVGRFFGLPTSRFSDESEPRPIDRLILEMSGRGISPAVSRSEALSVPAVQKGRNLICSVATLPLLQYGPDRKQVRSPLLDQLDPDVPNVVTLTQTVEDLLFDGISWWQVLETGWNDFPTSVRHLDVGSVSVDPPKGRSPAPLPAGYDPRSPGVWIDGKWTPARDVIRFDSPNPPVLKVGGRAIRKAILLDQAAAMYADDPRPLDYFTPTEGADPASDTKVQGFLDSWKAARKKRSTAYIPWALKYNTVDTPSPAELQLVELQKQAALEIANALGVDPEELGISTTTRTYANAVDRRRDRINDVLSPYMRAITDRLSMGDITRRGYRVAFDLDDYMRADPATRVQYYKGLHELGAIDSEEIRVEENLPDRPARRAPARPTPVDADARAVVAHDVPAAVTFDGPSTLTLDAEVVGFSVDAERRTIEGLVLPYGQTATKYGVRFRFEPGALRWTDPGRVKLLRDHDYRQPLGKAVALSESRAGLKAKFTVAPGPAGDEALALADHGTLDGLSVGVDFDMAADTVPAKNEEGTVLVRRADLRETSLTAVPAFDDARVSKVRAQRESEESGMPDEQESTETQTTPPAAGGVTLNQDQVTALLARPGALEALTRPQQRQEQQQSQSQTPPGALTLSAEQVDGLIRSGGLGVLLGMPQLTPAPQPEPERRVTVDPTRRTTVTASVNEELPYRFDRGGNLTRGTHDFSTDLVLASKGDGAALGRAEGFMRQQFGELMAEFDTDRADVAALNPNRQRPDMYVDQKDYQYPIWAAINKGTLPDGQPFVLPKFASASGLVSNHVEGTEPTPGVFTASSQTITPSAASGKVEITREAWESGGNPQLSGIIWRQMVRAWFEALEAAGVTMLDALTPTAITLPTAAVDAALVDPLTAALAALHYTRGGFRMRDFAVQIDLYKALVDAAGTDGRKLLPVLGPSNATGTTDGDFGAIMVGGLRGVPAWALAASGTVAASSYLFDRNDCHGWATAPNRLQFEYRVAYVDVAIWGWKATACTDVTGVREVIYDPTT
ncbi:HK97 family phage prohead protease [Micromonosporaceae bacterium B7E4]